MPVYHLTIHAYRSWGPDHRRGYTVRGNGYQPPDPDKADEYDDLAKQDAVTFDPAIQREILALSHQICAREGWSLEAFGSDATHTHHVISWRKFQTWQEADRRLKNLLALHLNRRRGSGGKRWFVRGRSAPRRVKDARHLKYLKETYLPDHPGVFWKRGMVLPQLP